MTERTATLTGSKGKQSYTVNLETLNKLSTYMRETVEEFDDETNYKVNIINADDKSIETVVNYINSYNAYEGDVDMMEPLDKPLRGTLESHLLPFEEDIVNSIEKDARVLSNLNNTLDFLHMPRFLSISLCILGLAVYDAERLEKSGKEDETKFLEKFRSLAKATE